MTLREAIQEASAHITARDAETLLAHLLLCDRAWLLAHIDDPAPQEALDQLRSLTLRRAAREPLQYLIGTQEFYGLSLRVTPDTLIPRPETELLVEAVLDWTASQTTPLSGSLRILDIGTGTGAIPIAIASQLPTAKLTAVDLSTEALSIARENAAAHHLAARIRFLESDLLAALDGESFDIIVSNPPYVPLGDAGSMQPEVVDHEPHLALFAGDDGLGIYRRLIPQAHAALKPGGLLALEFGFGQREALSELLRDWQHVRFLNDYADIPRMALAERIP